MVSRIFFTRITSKNKDLMECSSYFSLKPMGATYIFTDELRRENSNKTFSANVVLHTCIYRDVYCFLGNQSLFFLIRGGKKSHKMICKNLRKYALRYVLHSSTFILLIVEKHRLLCITYLHLC